MTNNEVIKTVCRLANRQDVLDYIDGKTDCSEETVKTFKTLTELVNLVVSELASSYIPMRKSEDATSSFNRVYYSALSEDLLKIISVKDMQGKEIDYVYSPEFITVGSSKVNIEYEYMPKPKKENEELGYSQKDLSTLTLAYGVLAEFAIVNGDFEEAVMWHKRFEDKIYLICAPKNKKIKTRSWV